MSKLGLKTHTIGNIGIYRPRVFCARSGISQLCFHHIPCECKGKYTLGLELSFSPPYMWRRRERYFRLKSIESSEGTDERNGIDQVKSRKRWHSILLFKYNIKWSSIFRILFIMNEHDLIQLKTVSGVKKQRNNNNSKMYQHQSYVLYY